MSKKSIGVRILKTEYINWRELQFIQQDNFKDIPDDAKHKLKASLVSNDFVQPFFVWQDPETSIIYCLDGRHRTIFLEELIVEGFDVPYQLPAVFLDCQDKKEAAKLVLTFSSIYAKVTQIGLNDFLTLNDLKWSEVKETIDLPDFSSDRFEQKFDVFGTRQADADEDPEFGVQQLELVVQPGDIFQLNGHRIACGSFKDSELVSALMEGEKGRVVFCDPPYNLPANFFTNKDDKRHKDFAMGAGEMTDEEFMQFLAAIMQVSKANTVEGAIHYIFMDFRHAWHMTEAGRRVYGKPEPKQVCVWVKDAMANGSFYRAQQELCFIFSDAKAKALWNNDLVDEGGFYKDDNEFCYIFKNGDAAKHLSHLDLKDRIRTNIWRYPSANSTANPDRYELKNHPTPKPVALVADALLDTTNEGDTIIDWFLGSGTSLISAEKTGRICRATEIEVMYVQHIICRYVRYCEKNDKQVFFRHLNGDLLLENILQTEAVL